MKREEKKNNWYGGVIEWLERMNITGDEEEIEKISKTNWKKEVKEKLGKIVEEEVEKKRKYMTKLRFTRGTQPKDTSCRARWQKSKAS